MVTEQHSQRAATALGPVRALDTGAEHADPPEPTVDVPAGLPSVEGLDGRAAELGTLAAMLAPDRTRVNAPAVCTVAGSAGVGKTALVVRAAHRAEVDGWFPGGVLFVDLHGYDPARRLDAQAALSALLRELGVPGEQIPQGQPELESLYRSVLADLARAGRPVLVLADNAATLDHALPLWPGAPQHRLLLTSRRPLPIPGARRLELGVLPIGEAVTVLDHATRAADPDDDRITAEPAAALRLARLSGGLPLALRITAAVAADQRDWSVTALAENLSAERDQLGERAQGSSAPIRVALAAALRHLRPEQAHLFRMLSLNPGPYAGVDGAAALLDADEHTTRTLLDGLLRAQLVHTAPGGARYGMHDVVRQYAVERCRRDETAETRAEAVHRLLLHYLAAIQDAAGHLDPAEHTESRFADRAAALAWLDAWRPTLIAAVPIAAGQGLDGLARDIPLGLLSYFDLRGYLVEWIATSQFAVAATRRLEDRAGEAACRNSLGLAYLASRRFAEAAECFHWASRLYQEVDDLAGLAAAMTNVGTTAHHLRRYAKAIGDFERALALYRELHDSHGQAGTLANLAGAHTELGQFLLALDCCQQAVRLFASTGDRQGEGRTLADVADLELRLGRPAKAVDSHRRALALHRETGDRHGEATTLNGLGNDHDALGQAVEAQGCYRQAIALSQRLGDRETEWRALTCLGNVESRGQRFADAVRAYQQAAVICRELGEQAQEGQVLGNLGMALARWGRLPAALDVHRQALAVHRRSGDRYGEGVALAELGTVHRDLGHLEQASQCYLRAITAFHDVRSANDVIDVERLLADLPRRPS